MVISEFKLELQSGNALSGSKSVIFLSHVTLKFDGWPWKTTGHLIYAMLSFLYHFVAPVNSNWTYRPEMLDSGENQQSFVEREIEIWLMTLNKVNLRDW